ncbi:MAG: DMT family protein [Kiritimatiellae bacterium]|nr:DMT family protein [Kiritimatiellia bacterium]
MNAAASAVGLLIISNTFMTFAWYAHLRNLGHKPWFIAVLASWGIALFEYIFQVPANRIGYTVLSLSQLKIIQEVITLSVFVPFAILYMRQAWTWNYLWAALCLLGAVFFMFREPIQPKPAPSSKTPSGVVIKAPH